MLKLIGSVFGSVASLTGVNAPRDDDFLDRLNHVITVAILSLFAVFVSTKQLAGDPINCWLSDNYKDSHRAYIHSFCWVRNTYRVSLEEGTTIPVEEIERQKTSVKYYQWIPVILMFQIFLFKLPNIVWIMLRGAAGISMEKVCTLAEKTQMGNMKTREKDISNIATSITRWLIYKREHHYSVFSRMRSRISRFSVIFFFLGMRNGTYLIGLYMFVKLLYFANIVCQFFMLSAFLGEDFGTYGFNAARHFRDVRSVLETHWFPRITFCDFHVRQLTNVHTHTTQCVLPVNMFNEKIFIFVWFWLFMMGIVNAFSFLSWLYKVVFRKNRVDYVEKYLDNVVDVEEGREDVDRFVNVFLRDDGVFLLRVISTNSSPLVMFDLVKELWALYKASYLNKKLNKNQTPRFIYPNIRKNSVQKMMDEEEPKLLKMEEIPKSS